MVRRLVRGAHFQGTNVKWSEPLINDLEYYYEWLCKNLAQTNSWNAWYSVPIFNIEFSILYFERKNSTWIKHFRTFDWADLCKATQKNILKLMNDSDHLCETRNWALRAALLTSHRFP